MFSLEQVGRTGVPYKWIAASVLSFLPRCTPSPSPSPPLRLPRDRLCASGGSQAVCMYVYPPVWGGHIQTAHSSDCRVQSTRQNRKSRIMLDISANLQTATSTLHTHAHVHTHAHTHNCGFSHLQR